MGIDIDGPDDTIVPDVTNEEISKLIEKRDSLVAERLRLWKQILEIDKQLEGVVQDSHRPIPARKAARKRIKRGPSLSSEARKRIAEAARKRWAKARESGVKP